MKPIPRKLLAATTSAAVLFALAQSVAHADAAAPVVTRLSVAYSALKLPDGRTATVYTNGMAELRNTGTGAVEDRMLPGTDLMSSPTGMKLTASKSQILVDLAKGAPTAYSPGRVDVVLAQNVSGAAVSVPRATVQRLGGLKGSALSAAAPHFTSSSALNVRLAQLGATRSTPLFAGLPATDASTAARTTLAHAFRIDISGVQVPQAVAELLASPDVASASPDWTVTTTNTQPRPLNKSSARPTAHPATGIGTVSGLPSNYALSTSAESLLNKPGINWAPAYRTLQQHYHQLPGAGEIITNVSLGDLTDAAMPDSDPCTSTMQSYGPTTVVQDGQRYLDLPSMPLIPTYVADTAGHLDGAASTCNQDPLDAEIDLDFSMMAGLPHDQQRAGAVGSGYTDLLGIAPGADYRLVVPGSQTIGISDIDTALLAAAQQTPRPDVITASLGFGNDSLGFPSRYLEDDPLTETLISFITHTLHIEVVVAANDGLRQQTNAAVGPSGGSAPTDLVAAGGQPTDLDDLTFSTAPSAVRDSGAIDVGATTLDDIFAAPPQDPANAALASQHTYPETRYDGSASYSSGYGSRVNLSAPGDNVLALQHTFGGQAGDVDAVLTGGTSASAPEVAAAAAVVRQAARLAGDTTLATNPTALRTWLSSTGTAVPTPPQSDQPLNVGPQLDLGNAVTTLVASRTGFSLPPGAPRVAIEQRRPYADSGAVFVSDTDPSAISLKDHDQDAWITIAPDWEGLPTTGKTSYRLSVAGKTLATTPYARLSPRQILTVSGHSYPIGQTTTVTLTYQATAAHGLGTTVEVPLTFTAVTGGSVPHAPDVPGLVTGATIPVHYDLSQFDGLTKPTLVVSAPGRMVPWDISWRIAYQATLTGVSGTIEVPVSALQGSGLYGIAIQADPQTNAFSDFAITRVRTTQTDARPPAPTVRASGTMPGHFVQIPYGGSFTVDWDVRSVPGAIGAELEVGAAGRTLFNSYSTFNNPNGSVEDENGLDFGDVHVARLPSTRGSLTLTGAQAGLIASMVHGVRVLPVTKSGKAAGEASDASAVQMSGMVAPAGQDLVSYPAFGFGVDHNGVGGIVASGLIDPTGASLVGPGAVQRFNQATNTSTGLAASATSGHLYGTVNAGGPGVFTGDVGLYQDVNWDAQTVDYHTVGLGPDGGSAPWTPPAGYLPPKSDIVTSAGQVLPADNQTAAETAFLSGENGHGSNWQVFTSDVAAGTFGPAYSLAAITGPMPGAELDGIAQDPTSDTAYVKAGDYTGADSKLISVNLRDGSLDSMNIGFTETGETEGIAVQAGSGVVMAGGLQTISRYDMANHTATTLTPGGNLYSRIVADSSRKEFLVREGAGPDFDSRMANPHAPGNIWNLTQNSNALSSVLVLDDQGRLLRRIERFNDEGHLLRDNAATVQINPATGIGYAYGQDGTSLQPFDYIH